jgi:hypothetical protein
MLVSLTAAAVPAVQDTAYFQQGVEYTIEASLDEGTSVLAGRAEMRYTNHSGRRLDTLYFHLHLNAFRPNSAWARRDAEMGTPRFNDLGPDDHAFERWKSVAVNGQAVTPLWPGAPDSTVAAVPLPSPLGPGESLTVLIDWDARLSTLPRRQGRRDRHHDFAQWYPKVAVFDRDGWQVQPLMPQGEFYGEFATFDVTLDVAADQVMGATGTAVSGDPGWAGARAAGVAEPDLKRDYYGSRAARPLGMLEGDAAAGRKRVRWYARDVHHFAWTTNPAYIYETGSYEDIAIHVLYQPGDDDWASGVAVQRTVNALAFFDTIFGDFAWPQLTNVHRIEGGGTEFPMMIMDGSASQGLIVHEVAHNYTMGILANNEWKQGWLDEGFASFLGSWYSERRDGDPAQIWAGSLNSIRERDAAGQSEPISMASAAFSDFATYNAMTYTKPSLVYRMLRYLTGEETFHEGLRLYYERKKLEHVREEDLRAAMEEASGRDLRWFFQQWIHTTATLDYAVESATTVQTADGQWETTVTVSRAGEAWMPVQLRVGTETRMLDSRDRTQTVTIRTAARPDRVVVDPDNMLIDIDPSNNTRDVG